MTNVYFQFAFRENSEVLYLQNGHKKIMKIYNSVYVNNT